MTRVVFGLLILAAFAFLAGAAIGTGFFLTSPHPSGLVVVASGPVPAPREPEPMEEPPPAPPRPEPEVRKPVIESPVVEIPPPEPAPEPAPSPVVDVVDGAPRPIQKPAGQEVPPSGRRIYDNYSVQVGTFRVSANAQGLWKKLADAGRPAKIVEWRDAYGKLWYAVRVGEYASVGDARTMAQTLRADGQLAPIVIGY